MSHAFAVGNGWTCGGRCTIPEHSQPHALAALRAHITRSSLSTTEYARYVVVRDPRQVRRWLAGTMPIPEAVAHWLARAPLGLTARATRVD